DVLEVIGSQSGPVHRPDDDAPRPMSRRDRLVLFSDLAGHPNFRRTTIGGLVGWASHWTVLCISATCGLVRPRSNRPSESVDLRAHSEAYLNLCLRLKLPLVIAITKMDLTQSDLLRKV